VVVVGGQEDEEEEEGPQIVHTNKLPKHKDNLPTRTHRRSRPQRGPSLLSKRTVCLKMPSYASFAPTWSRITLLHRATIQHATSVA
jgi:hypothetical protein